MAKKVQVLLVKDFYNLGKTGDIVEVKLGYARNYLVPQKIALPLTEGLLKNIEQQKKSLQLKNEKFKQKSLKIKEKIENQRVTINLPVGKDGKLYQAITKERISSIIKEKFNEEVDKYSINLDKPIKSTGIYNIELMLPGSVKTSFELEIES